MFLQVRFLSLCISQIWSTFLWWRLSPWLHDANEWIMLTGYGLLDIWLEAMDFGMQACAYV
jgi:hypothetical protein